VFPRRHPRKVRALPNAGAHNHQLECDLELDANLLRDNQFTEYPEDYKGCYNAQGLYNSMQFVLRLRPDIHALLDQTTTGLHSAEKYDFVNGARS